MSDLTNEQCHAIEANLQRAHDEPMPPKLKERIKALIVPHTMNNQIKHVDVMECINVSFPVIRDWLRAHPEGETSP